MAVMSAVFAARYKASLQLQGPHRTATSLQEVHLPTCIAFTAIVLVMGAEMLKASLQLQGP